ncbi:MAG TPA: hypothetical protein VFR25_05265 [Candidatus Eisenbacteria bacterium]|nr:hypothetical protein [Candidatus Eisenbacteria bacterium]
MTKRWGWRWCAALVLAAAMSQATAGAATHPREKSWSWTFEADTLGKEPNNSGLATGTWEVASLASDSLAADGAAGGRVLRQLEGEDGADYHMLQLKKPIVNDLVASVRFRVVSGEVDPGAGLLFHLDDKARNGYLIRVSGAKGRVIAHYIIYGRRRDIRYASIEPPKPGEWHTISVNKKKSVIVVSYDGTECLRFRDERFKRGTVGFWTEDDAVVDFADLKVAMN